MWTERSNELKKYCILKFKFDGIFKPDHSGSTAKKHHIFIVYLKTKKNPSQPNFLSTHQILHINSKKQS